MKEITSNTPKAISIVIPVLNEADNISPLVKRIAHTMSQTDWEYELIFVDDFSVDDTAKQIKKLAKTLPIHYFIKKGTTGKAQSLLEGFTHAKYPVIGMIDADLQYPPEALPSMLKQMEAGKDVVVANRTELQTSKVRIFFSKAFNYVFCRLLHKLDLDVQSGMKIFKKEIIERIQLEPLPWTFDLEFLVLARSAGYTVGSVPITFERRQTGESKVQIFQASWQIGSSAVLLKLKKHPIIPLHPDEQKKHGPGFHYKKVKFIPFSDVHFSESAIQTTLSHQDLIMFSFLMFFLAGMLLNWIVTLVVVLSVVTVIYFADLIFNLYLIFRTFTRLPEIKVSLDEIDTVTNWPTYTILCPLYKEWIVVPQFIKAIERLEYPKEKLQVQLLLEEDDVETIEHVKSYTLPSYVQIIVVPDTLPKTKPKACNYGLMSATGEYAVIYDAEDMPDPLQLKKAVLAFQKSDPNIACIQAKLNYYNTKQNLLTRLFTAEYTLWFDLILTGLQSLNAPIPLGGTSNHFKVDKLREVKGWDSFNVTEDCDLGIRLAKRGYRTAIVDSVTMEEANSEFFNWINQRSRWIKGYIQTYLVHMRYPSHLMTKNFKSHFFTFQLVVGGKILSLFINPLMWLTTILYFTMRAIVGTEIEKFFPGPIFYMAVFSLIVGNFLYMYYYMIACAKRQQFDLIKYVYLVPFYWIIMSFAAWKGLIQLISNPHYWPKTKHGLHLDKPKITKVVEEKKQYKLSFALPQLKWKRTKTIKTNEKNSNWTAKTISSSTVFICALLGANFLNFLFSTYFGRKLKFEDFGLLTLVNSLSFLINLFFSALTTSVNHRVAYLSTKEYPAKANSFFKQTYKRILKYVLIFSVIWAVCTPVIMNFFHLTSALPILVMLLVIFFGVVNALNEGFLSGTLQFIGLAIINLTIPLIKLGSGFYLELTSQHLTYLAIPLSIVAPVGISSFLVWKKIHSVKEKQEVTNYSFPFTFYLSSLISSFSISSFITLDILFVQHYLPQHAGEYAVLALAGKMIYFLGSLPNAFIVSFVSRDLGSKINPQKTFYRIFACTALLTLGMFGGIGLLGHITLPILFGAKIAYVLPYVLIYSLAITFISFSTTIPIYHLTLHHYSFPAFALFNTTAMLIGMNLYHGSIQQVTHVMLTFALINFVGMSCLHLVKQNGQFIIKNIVDFVCLFLPLPQQDTNDTRKKVLIYNWRDIRHTFAGGAEVYIHELAKRWVMDGYQVVMFCGNDGHSPRNENIDGVQIIRRGGFYMVYVWAFFYYILRFRKKFDIIIDCENGIPFFTPLYAGEKIFLLIHHVHQEVFRNSLIAPLAYIATVLEIKLMPFIYKNVEIITVSESSKQEIKRMNLSKKDPAIIYNGVDTKTYKRGLKQRTPMVLYVGRLKKYKSLHIYLQAAKEVLKTKKNVLFVIAGDGEEKKKLQNLAKRLGIANNVLFLGKVSEEKKIQLYQQAWVFVQPSFMEGWSLTTIEANACGTPVVASNVAGLRDSVADTVSGYLVAYGDYQEFAKKIVKIIANKQLREDLSDSSYKWASKYSWEISAIKSLALFSTSNEKLAKQKAKAQLPSFIEIL